MKVAALVLAVAVFSALSQEIIPANNVALSTNAPEEHRQKTAPAPTENGSSASKHAAGLQAMFGERTNLIAFPQVTPGSAISAAEVLGKALDARGGAAAASKVRSLRAKGRIDLDNSLLAVSPVEYLAQRPNQFRMTIDLKPLAGGDIGRLDQGFDGKNGWDMEPGGPVRVSEGKILQERSEGAEFFAWYAERGNYLLAEVLGKADYGGRKCYALKMVTRSGRETMHYYDAATFLLVGLMGTVETEAGPALRKLSFDDYRAFDGFQIPTLLTMQTQAKGAAPRSIGIEFSSIQLNALKETVKMPVDQR